MILENKFIRIKRQRQRLITVILIVFFLLFFAVVVLLSNTQDASPVEVENTLTISGMLSKDNNYPLYTHSLLGSESSFYLKSSTINLNQLIDQEVLLWGTVVDTHDKKPIIDVAVIQDSNASYILKNGTYIFPHNFFLLDVQQDANISVAQNTNKIEVYYSSNLAFEVNSFLCNKVVPNQDCEVLRKDLIGKYVKTFTSPHGYQFYQSTDTLRYVLDKNSPIAYVFTVPDEEDIINLSYIFRPLDGKFIKDTNPHLIQNSCIDEGETYVDTKEIVEQNIKGGKFLQLELKVNTKQKQSDGNNISKIKDCTLLIDIFDIALWSEIDLK